MRGYITQNVHEKRQWLSLDEFLCDQRKTRMTLKVLISIVCVPVPPMIILFWFPTVYAHMFFKNIAFIEYLENEVYKIGPRLVKAHDGYYSIAYYDGIFISLYSRLVKSGWYEDIYRIADGNYVLCRGGKYGLFNTMQNRLVSECLNDEIYLNGDHIVISKNGEITCYSLKGYPRFFE